MRTAFVLDSSVTLTWAFPDETTKATARLLDDLVAGAEAWVPALWHLELGNVLVNAQKRGRVNRASIEIFVSRLGAFHITVDSETMARAWNKTLDLAFQYKLSTYDAAYLELALRRNLPLATLDDALIIAAKAAGIPLRLPIKS